MSDLIEVKLSEKTTVQIKELNAFEAGVPDTIIGSNLDSPLFVAKVYAMCSIRSINGDPVAATNNAEYKRIATRLSMTEAMTLAVKYNELFAPPSGEELKNESGTEDEAPSPPSSQSDEVPSV